MTHKKAFKLLTNYINCWSSGNMCLSFDLESEHDRDLLKAFQMARKALDKAIPKKPVFSIEHIVGRIMSCPSCGMCVYDSGNSNSYNQVYHKDFCLCCGQRFTAPLSCLGEWAEE